MPRDENKRGCEFAVEIAIWCSGRRNRTELLSPSAATTTQMVVQTPKKNKRKKKHNGWEREMFEFRLWRSKIFTDTGAAGRYSRAQLLQFYGPWQDKAPASQQSTSCIGSIQGFTLDGVVLYYSNAAHKNKHYLVATHKSDIITWHSLTPTEAPRFAGDQSVTLKWCIAVTGVKWKPKQLKALEEEQPPPIGAAPAKVGPGIPLEGNFKVELTIHRGDKVKVDVGMSHDRDQKLVVRRLFLTDQISICLEHRRPEASLNCFCSDAVDKAVSERMVKRPNSVVRWGSAADYANFWNSVVELEAATVAVEERQSKLISGVNIQWLDTRRGRFELPYSILSTNSVRFRSVTQGSTGVVEWSAGWLCMRQHDVSGDWNGHGAVTSVHLVHKDGRRTVLSAMEEFIFPKFRPQDLHIEVDLKLMGGSTAPNQQVSVNCMVEYFTKGAPYTYMAMSLARLHDAAPIVKEVLLNATAPLEVCPHSGDLSDWELNPSQEDAVRLALEEPLALVHGPPGTGKTRMAATLAVLYALQNSQEHNLTSVLYCTPSNDVADLACMQVELLFEECMRKKAAQHMQTGQAAPPCIHTMYEESFQMGVPGYRRQSRGCRLCKQQKRTAGALNVLRLYSQELERADFPIPKKGGLQETRASAKGKEVKEEMRRHALHWRCHGVATGVQATPEAKTCGRLYAKLLEMGTGSADFLSLRQEYSNALLDARVVELAKADVIFTTCATARMLSSVSAYDPKGSRKFAQVIVDEAAQVAEPDTLCPLMLSQDVKRIALIGDPKQLRPIVRSRAAKVLGMNVSLLERLSFTPEANPNILSLQYRMHPVLNNFASGYFYSGEVATDVSVAIREPGMLSHPGRPYVAVPFLFWNIVSEGACKETRVMTPGASGLPLSHVNVGEALKATTLARRIAATARQQDQPVTVGILTWYNAQVGACSPLLLDEPDVFVGNVVNSQGSEYDYVILSTVRSGAHPGLGVVGDPHFLNVALTRARHGLCILGCLKLLRNDPCWNAFLAECEMRGAICRAQPTLVDRARYPGKAGRRWSSMSAPDVEPEDLLDSDMSDAPWDFP